MHASALIAKPNTPTTIRWTQPYIFSHSRHGAQTNHIVAIMPYKIDKSTKHRSVTDITAKKYRSDQMESLSIVQGEQAEPLSG